MNNNTLIKNLLIIILIIQIVAFTFLFLQLRSVTYQQHNTNKLILQKLIKSEIENIELTIDSNDIIIGNDTAPLTVYMFSKYNCSACNSFFRNTFPEIEKQYITPGKIKFVLKLIIPQISEGPDYLSKSMICLNKQGQFSEFNNLLINSDELLDSAQFKSMILKNEKIDIVAFNNCMASDELKSYLIENKKTFKKKMIRGTPAFIINKKLILGDKSFAKFQEILEENLNDINQ